MKTIKKTLTIMIIALLVMVSLSTKAQLPIIQMQKTLGGSLDDFPALKQRYIQTADGGYIVAGSARSNDGDVSGNHGGTDYWVVKLNVIGSIVWQKTLGGSGHEQANCIQQTSDGGYIMAGYSLSNDGDVTGNHGNEDFWIVKLDGSGNITWQKSLGGSSTDVAHSIQQTSDGGFIVAGISSSIDGNVTGNHGNADYWVVRLTSTGNITWQKSLGGSAIDWAYSTQQTSDGGFIVAGYSLSTNGNVTGHHGTTNFADYWIVKLDASGGITWQKSLGGTNDEIALSIQQTIDGGYVVTGSGQSTNGDVTGNHGVRDYWIVKLTNLGAITWQKSLGGSNTDVGYAIQQTTDNGYIVAGYSQSNNGDVTGNHGLADYWVVKLNNTGSLTWQTSLGGSGDDVAYAIHQTNDGKYIMAGYTFSNNGDLTGNHSSGDIWVVKLAGPSVPVPTLSQWGLIVMGMLMLGVVFVFSRRILV